MKLVQHEQAEPIIRELKQWKSLLDSIERRSPVTNVTVSLSVEAPGVDALRLDVANNAITAAYTREGCKAVDINEEISGTTLDHLVKYIREKVKNLNNQLDAI